MNSLRRIAVTSAKCIQAGALKGAQRNSVTPILQTTSAGSHLPSRNGYSGTFRDKPGAKKLVQDFAVPNELWPAEAIEIYKKLERMAEHPNWVPYFGKFIETDEGNRSFMRAVPNKQFLYSLFLNVEERKAKGVITFGPWAEGDSHKDHVHGGAVASILDSITGVLANVAVAPSVTANLNIDYASPFRLGQACMVQASVTNVRSRKIHLDCSITDITGELLVVKGTALFIKVKKVTESEFMNE